MRITDVGQRFEAILGRLRRLYGTCLKTLPHFALLALLWTTGCHSHGPFEAYGAPSGTFSIAVGQELDIQLRTVGPGEYVSPPTLDGATVAFLRVTAGTTVPSGVQQVFHFEGVSSGPTILVFHNTNPPGGFAHPDVIDTVNVH
jgi:hypothetical protein